MLMRGVGVHPMRPRGTRRVRAGPVRRCAVSGTVAAGSTVVDAGGNARRVAMVAHCVARGCRPAGRCTPARSIRRTPLDVGALGIHIDERPACRPARGGGDVLRDVRRWCRRRRAPRTLSEPPPHYARATTMGRHSTERWPDSTRWSDRNPPPPAPAQFQTDPARSRSAPAPGERAEVAREREADDTPTLPMHARTCGATGTARDGRMR